jgi:hypothetical protein
MNLSIISIILLITAIILLIVCMYRKKSDENFNINIVPLLPNLVGMSYNDATRELQNRKINSSFGGNQLIENRNLNNKISKQEPAAGSPYNENTIVKLFVGQFREPEKKYLLPTPKPVENPLLKEKVKELQGNDDKYRFATPRNYRNVITLLRGEVIKDKQYDWSDNVFGLTATKNHMYIAVDNRKKLQYTPISADDSFGQPEVLQRRSIFSDPEYAYPTPIYCEYGKYGQGQSLYKEDDEYVVIPIKGCENGTFLSGRFNGRLSRDIAFIPNLRLDWIAYDPLSKFFFIPLNGSRLDKVQAIDLVATEFDYPSFTNSIVRYVKDVTFKLNGNAYVLNDVVACCFSKNGIFYALCNGNSQQPAGVYVFWLHYTGNDFHLMKYLKLDKKVEERIAGISIGDTQKYVGMTCKNVGDRVDLYVLHLNNDAFSTDNISLYKFENVL